MDEQRALLDQLMGSQRDVPDELKREVHFYDREIDKFWLLGVQPFDLFKNTIWAPKLPVFHRMALGYEWEKREQPLSVLAEWDALDFTRLRMEHFVRLPATSHHFEYIMRPALETFTTRPAHETRWTLYRQRTDATDGS